MNTSNDTCDACDAIYIVIMTVLENVYINNRETVTSVTPVTEKKDDRNNPALLGYFTRMLYCVTRNKKRRNASLDAATLACCKA